MEQITLIKRNGTQVNLFSKEPFRTVKSATQSKSLTGIDTVTLSIVSRDVLTFDGTGFSVKLYYTGEAGIPEEPRPRSSRRSPAGSARASRGLLPRSPLRRRGICGGTRRSESAGREGCHGQSWFSPPIL